MITPKAVVQALKKRSFFVPIAALAAGVDAADVPLMRVPCACEIIGINIIPQGDDAGIDGSNSSVWTFEVGATALVTPITYDDSPTFPDKGVVTAFTLVDAAKKRAEGDVITYSVTNGTTAATPACMAEIEVAISDEAVFDTQHTTSYATGDK